MVGLLGTQVDLSKTIVILHRRLRVDVLNDTAEIARYNWSKFNLYFLHSEGGYDFGNTKIQRILRVSICPLKNTATRVSRGQQYV